MGESRDAAGDYRLSLGWTLHGQHHHLRHPVGLSLRRGGRTPARPGRAQHGLERRGPAGPGADRGDRLRQAHAGGSVKLSVIPDKRAAR
ncbi:hypothetical protein ACRAWD_26305 [Caulobacter segnis]